MGREREVKETRNGTKGRLKEKIKGIKAESEGEYTPEEVGDDREKNS